MVRRALLAAGIVGIAVVLPQPLNLDISAWFFIGGALVVTGALDAALHPESVWRTADQSKVVWVALQLGGLAIMFIPGVIAALVYFVAIRPQLRTSLHVHTADKT
jgi:hypothetical protein